MITQGEDVEINALRKRGWSYAAIGRHIGRDWRTVKDYLEDKRQPGVRRRPGPGPLERFVPYLSAHFVDDPHVWASTRDRARLRMQLPVLRPPAAPGRPPAPVESQRVVYEGVS
jgi:transposase